MDILFVMPGEPIDAKTDGLRIVGGSGSFGSCDGKDGERGIMRTKPVGVLLGPYMTDGSYRTDKGSAEGAAQRIPAAERYGEDIYREVSRYAERARSIAGEEEFDIVHVHDWMAVPAGIAAKEMRGVPLVVHVHSLESDRTPLRIDERVVRDRAVRHESRRPYHCRECLYEEKDCGAVRHRSRKKYQ